MKRVERNLLIAAKNNLNPKPGKKGPLRKTKISKKGSFMFS